MYKPPPNPASPSPSPQDASQRPPGPYPHHAPPPQQQQQQHPPIMSASHEPAANGSPPHAHQPSSSTSRAAGRFFDPISDSRPSRPPPSPSHSVHHQSPLPPQPAIDRRPYEREHPSPGPLTYQHNTPAPSHLAHPYSDHLASSPRAAPSNTHVHALNSTPMASQPSAGPPVAETRQRSTSRVDNPMSFSSILSSNDAPSAPQTDRKSYPPSTPQPMDVDAPRPATNYPPMPKPEAATSHYPPAPLSNGNSNQHYQPVPPPAVVEAPTKASWSQPPATNGGYDPIKSNAAPKGQSIVSEDDLEKALNNIEASAASDFEDGAYYDRYKAQYKSASLKRLHALDVKENYDRKRRRIAFVKEVNLRFSHKAELAKERYNAANRDEVYNGVIAEDMARDKERKKINQRTRRREVQKAKHEAQVSEYLERAEQATTMEERAKMIQQATKFERKARHTEILLNGEDVSETRDATPAASALGGILGSFPISEDGQETPKSGKKARTGRLKKSKEQKQAEKDSAAAAHAAMERGDEPIMIAPKGELKPALSDSLDPRDSTPADKPLSQVSVKAYDTVFRSVWKEISKDLRTITRAKTNSARNKEENLRKTALLASKEARRWQLKTNKSQKEQQARAKRAMREMLGFWKRNEREERDMRKMAEKQELENAKKAEADREANRQKRKLNFLISQTELYSHFIGKKVRTDEAEQTSDVAASGQTIRDGPANAHTINLPDSVANPSAKVTNFEDLDFDAEDETALQAAAMANAQNAVKEAQDRARAFNNQQEEQSVQAQLDEMDGEMNFQNPTSLQSMDIPQPKLLSCQLKEYQLKGLNWLVNLYEQGINGILADEMGLGKTVQSISVMAYLAQVHNIWGPFLVIAPSSTLHNWQQEITRFVPEFKVLPYWGNAKDRKVLRKIWDRKHITYSKESSFHVLITSYQLVVQDSAYLQKMKWQYMILDEAQAIKSSQSSRWKHLLSFHCRNRLLLTGTPIQNNMQELWALLHFIMPSLFDSHDEFSDWFSKDIESHAQSNTKLNEDQLKRLHMILKPFMLRRIKKHVQKELGDKVEKDVFCDLTYRQRAFYVNLRNKISILDLIEKATVGDNEDTATLMNLVMQFRKVCNHPDLFERADTTSPVAFSRFAETASFMREGQNVDVLYSVKSPVELHLPKLVARDGGRLDIAGPDNQKAGWRSKYLRHMMNIWDPEHIHQATEGSRGFSWLPLLDVSANQVSNVAHQDVFGRAITEFSNPPRAGYLGLFDADDDKENVVAAKGPSVLAEDDFGKRSLLNIVPRDRKFALPDSFRDGALYDLMNVSRQTFDNQGLNAIEPCSRPAVQAPPVELLAASQGVLREKEATFFSVPIRRSLYGVSQKTEEILVEQKADPRAIPPHSLLPEPLSAKSRYTHIEVPSMRRFVTDSGKLAKLDELLKELKAGGHRVLLYFQMTRMIDLMEEYLTYRNYKYCRLDGSTKLEDRRDTVADFQQNPEIFVFLLSTRAGGLGINLTAADTVIFYDSDWNPTIDSQAMDRAHRLGQTRQVTVYRLITRNTIEERIRRRALQKEEVQRVVISGGAGATVDFNNRSQRENRTKDIAMWLADDDQAAEIERAEQEMAEREAREGPRKTKKKAGGRAKEVSLDDMYHEGEGNFDDGSKGAAAAAAAAAQSGDSTPAAGKRGKGGKGMSKKAKSQREKLAIIDGTA